MKYRGFQAKNGTGDNHPPHCHCCC